MKTLTTSKNGYTKYVTYDTSHIQNVYTIDGLFEFDEHTTKCEEPQS